MAIFVALAAVLVSMGLIAPVGAQSAPGSDEVRLAVEFVGQINSERVDRGLSPLPLDVGLSAETQRYAEELSSINQLVHDDSGLAEIIGYGFRSGTITAAYMASPTHRHLIVDPNAEAIGVGVVCDPNGRMWMVARFTAKDPSLGSNRSSDPSPVATDASFGSRCGEDAMANELLRLYLAYYLRPADGGGLHYWLDQRNSGVPLSTVSNAFASAREFDLRYGSVDNDEFVSLVYRNVMQREPDASGLAYWRTQMRNGMTRGEVMIAFSDSAEFRLRTGLN